MIDMLTSLSSTLQHLTSTYPKVYAVAGCLLCTGTYVGLLYAWRGMPRSHPSTIKRRMLSVGAACSVSWVPLYLVLPKGAKLQQVLGLARPSLPAVTLPLALTATFFAGPLIFRLADPATRDAATSAASTALQLLGSFLQGHWSKTADLALASFNDEQSALVTLRNLVVAPATEEFVFRGCMAPLLRLQGFGFLPTVYITPLFFGAAHLHHLYDLLWHQKVQVVPAVSQVAFQFAYTTVFGWYETLVFLRTNSLVSAVFVHTFCNWMGVPDLKHMARQAGGSVVVPLVLTTAGVVGFVTLFHPLIGPSQQAGR